MLLISDANIFIDLDKIGILELCSKLSHKIVTTDFVYNELYHNQKSTLDKINIEILSFEDVELLDFYQTYGGLGQVGISSPDYSLIYKAKKVKGAIVTGDGTLRNYIKRENIDVYGIFFILDTILNENLLSYGEWLEKLKLLQQLNKRLPRKEFEKRLIEKD